MRSDRRRDDEVRSVRFQTGVSRYAEGSCLVTMGHTRVLCTATVEETVPRFLRNTGRGWVTAEYAMLPRSCEERVPRDITKGKVSGRSQEIQRLIGRSLRAVMDLERVGERTIWVDCDVLQADGGTRCAAVSGAYVALAHACRKLVRSGVLSASPLLDHVAAVSVGMIAGRPVLDLTYEEDANADLDMNVVMTAKGRFVEIQGTAEKTPFNETDLKRLLRFAKLGIKKILIHQQKIATVTLFFLTLCMQKHHCWI